MFKRLREWRDRRLIRRHPIEPKAWTDTLSNLPILQGLSEGERARLGELTALFLQRKTFIPVQGLRLTPSRQLLIATQACLPVLNLDFGWYDEWRSVIVYPGRFIRPRSEVDAIGVMHEWSEVLGGEAWHRGPVVLSWADVAGSGFGDGYNVILHEMAHQLDMLNGEADGFPPLHRSMQASMWNRAFSTAFEALNATIDQGMAPMIDPYAGESPAECFAVFSEYFFETPALISQNYPDVYRQLQEFYRQDPIQRLP